MTDPHINQLAREILSRHDQGTLTLTFLENALTALVDDIRKDDKAAA